jgi:hypothetical protein
MIRLLAASMLALAGCAHAPPPEPAPCPYASAHDGTQSDDLLCRDPVAVQVKVKHILLGWKEQGTASHPVDPRAAERTEAETQKLARDLLERIRGGAPIESLMAQFSEDPGSAQSGRAYEASPSAALVPPFKALAVRLHVGEAGIVKSDFGLHIIQRVP